MDQTPITTKTASRHNPAEPADNEPGDLDLGHVLLDIWAMVRRRKWHVIGSIIVGLVLGGLYLAQATPIYRATTKVVVFEKNPMSLPFEGQRGAQQMAARDDYLNTHAYVIRTPAIVEQARKSAGLDHLPSIQKVLNETNGTVDVTAAIIEKLVVTKDSKGARALKLTYDGTDRDDCVKIINAVVSSYIDFVDKLHKDTNEDIRELLVKAKDELLDDLTAKQTAYRTIQEEDPLVIAKGASGISMALTGLSKLDTERSVAKVQRLNLEAQIRQLEEFQAKSAEPVELTGVTSLWDSFIDVLTPVSHSASRGSSESSYLMSALVLRLLELMEKEQELRLDFQPNSPKVQRWTNELNVWRNFGESLMRLRLKNLNMELATSRAFERDLDEKFNEEKEILTDVTVLLAREEESRKDLERHQKLFDTVVEQLKGVHWTEDHGTITTQVVEPAVRPRSPVQPKVALTLALALFLGSGLGLGLAYLAEKTDKSFRSPLEIKKSLGLPIFGHVPAMVASDFERKSDMGCRTHDAPRSLEAEAYRTVRTGLCFSFRSQSCPVIQITSPAPGDGKSTLAANLAISLAQTKKRVLLIDADLRRPTQHGIFNVPRDTGFSDLLAGQTALEQAVIATRVAGLDLLACGQIPPNPAELLTSNGFQEMIDAARQRYDYLILDTPPVLAVADASIVAAHTDGVLMVVRISKNGRPAALNAREMLDSTGARVLGVVVNGVRKGREGYGYNYADNYAYSYGYGYGSYVSETAGNHEPQQEESAERDPTPGHERDNGSKDRA